MLSPRGSLCCASPDDFHYYYHVFQRRYDSRLPECQGFGNDGYSAGTDNAKRYQYKQPSDYAKRFMSVPESLSEAAEIDGASHRQILFQVMVPLVKATMAVLVLYYGVAHWNSWFNASIYLRSSDKFPLQLVLRNILIEGETNDMLSDVGSADNPQAVQLLKYSLIVVSTLPIMCIYLSCRDSLKRVLCWAQ